MVASPNFIYKGFSPTLDADMSVAIANESDMIIALAVSLYITNTDKLLDQMILELDKKDIEAATEAGTLVASVEQGYLEMIQYEKNQEVAFHKSCECHLVH